jgi:hypothetical protein
MMPKKVKVIKACKLYDSRDFKDNTVRKLKKGDVLPNPDVLIKVIKSLFAVIILPSSNTRRGVPFVVY